VEKVKEKIIIRKYGREGDRKREICICRKKI
jgi:hypothetical protein